MAGFSFQNRTDIAARLQADVLDVLVIGGGVTGAGIALDAVTRGLTVGLVEMQDFASGTSSRSTKLVHGGLRYLRQFDVALVAEVGRERAIVFENAPHVTTPVWMMLPIIPHGTYGKFLSWVGLSIYDRLARVRRSERRRMLNRVETMAKEPLLRDDVRGAGYYVEYRTDDARLTLEIMKEAVDRGAGAINYTKVEQLLYREAVNGAGAERRGPTFSPDPRAGIPAPPSRTVCGAVATDGVTGESYTICARKVVNATGPWVDALRELDGSKTGKTLHLTKGVHIVVDQSKFPLRNPVYFDVPDGRMVFAIPREGKTYVGTTDTDYTANPLTPRTSAADRDYLIDCVNDMFPQVGLAPGDIESFWAGVRPLIQEAGKGPSEISRKDEIFVSPSGLITMAGGKLTGYRHMAEQTVSLIAQQLQREIGREYRACQTSRLELSGGKFSGSDHLERYVSEQTAVGVGLGLTAATADKLARRYGTNIEQVWDFVRTHGAGIGDEGLPGDVYAALLYGMTHEMVVTPTDFFVRRTGAMFFHINFVQQWKDSVISYMATYCGWSQDQTGRYRVELEERLEEATQVV